MIETDSNRTSYSCDGVQTDFTFSFKIFEKDDLTVILTDSDGNETTLSRPGEYTVSATNEDYSNGGTVTTVDTYAAGNTITIIREIAYKQESDYTVGGPLPAETLENNLDRLTMLAQQNSEKTERTLKLKKSTSYSGLTIPDPIADYYLAWKNDLSGLKNVVVESSGTLTVSDYIKTLLDDADAATAQSTLGISDYMKTLLDDTDIATAQKTLEVDKILRNIIISNWTTRTSAADNDWYSVCWSPDLGLFCAVSWNGTGDRVMTSPDGINWTTRTSAADNDWMSVCWSSDLGLFCAVSSSGTGNRVMTSPDGINWTIRTSAADNDWYSVCWSPDLGLFCAVSWNGTGDRVMTSPDGINWTTRTSAA
ncbi:MAG: hypothetical protein ACOC80_10410, partial [Petrotogales bacterium]